MADVNDMDLLQEYLDHKSEAAFAGLVRHHLNLVYSVALRFTGNSADAQDVAQSVFVILAQKAVSLRTRTTLTGWLYETTRFVARQNLRTRHRQQTRDQEAYMQSTLNESGPDAAWQQLAPLLEEGMSGLNENERTLLALRFFENKSAVETAALLGIQEWAAHKRSARAVEKLRAFFSRRGVALSATALTAAISANAIQAAPAGLVTAITTTALAGTMKATAITAALKTSSPSLFSKAGLWSLGALTTATVAIIVGHLLLSNQRPTISAAIPVTKAQIGSASAGSGDTTNHFSAANPPDLQHSLRLAVQARQRLTSGVIEFQYFTERTSKSGFLESNPSHFTVTFDGPKLRFESSGTEYAYKFDEDQAQQAAITRQADGMDRQSAVKAGLLEAFSSRHTLVHDGDMLMDLWLASNQRPSVNISAISEGAHIYSFDPRCLGFSNYLPIDRPVEQWLNAGPLQWVGDDTVEGIPAIHLRFNNSPQEYWLDKAHPEHVLQYRSGENSVDQVTSRYDDRDPRDPLPIEVESTTYRDGKLTWHSKLTRLKTGYNVTVDSSSFTLAGMGIPVGTPVSDDRIMRRIGYWTGSGLSEQFISQDQTNIVSAPAPTLSDLLATLTTDPQSPVALSNSIAIILNNPDGPAVRQAADVILQYHTQDTNLTSLCRELDRVRPACSKELLVAILQNNPSPDVQGHACLTLAGLWKSDAHYGTNPDATAQAINYYQDVINRFASFHERGYPLDQLARPELNELQNLILGKPAPETVGVDMHGRPLDLKNYRGQIVALVFWNEPFSELARINQTHDELADKPFAIIGVNCEYDWQLQKSAITNLTWPSFRDGREGPIAKAWHNNSWPDIWILDRQGIIRYRGLREWDIKPSVEALLKE